MIYLRIQTRLQILYFTSVKIDIELPTKVLLYMETTTLNL